MRGLVLLLLAVTACGSDDAPGAPDAHGEIDARDASDAPAAVDASDAPAALDAADVPAAVDASDVPAASDAADAGATTRQWVSMCQACPAQKWYGCDTYGIHNCIFRGAVACFPQPATGGACTPSSTCVFHGDVGCVASLCSCSAAGTWVCAAATACPPAPCPGLIPLPGSTCDASGVRCQWGELACTCGEPADAGSAASSVDGATAAATWSCRLGDLPVAQP